MDLLCHVSSAFPSSFTVPVINSFSLALVIATYRILISSLILSRIIFLETALFIIVWLFVLSLTRTTLVPIPSSLSITTSPAASLLFIFLPIPVRITTGNSRPLLLWILITRTRLSFSPSSDASPISTSNFFIRSMYLKKLNNPL